MNFQELSNRERAVYFGQISGGGVPFKSDLGAWYNQVSDDLFLENQMKLDADILPATGFFNGSDSYAIRSEANFGQSDSSGYIEAKIYNPQYNSASTYGIVWIFTTNDLGSGGRYSYFALTNGVLEFALYDTTGTRRIIRHSNDAADKLTKGWHTVKLSSNGSAYSMFIDGVEQTTIYASLGSNDGYWFDQLDTRTDVISMGVLRQATNAYNNLQGGGFISYIDYNNSNKWIMNTKNYIYDIIGGKHLTWSGTGTKIKYTEEGSTHALLNGYSLWEHATSDPIKVPFSSTGSALSLTPGADIPTGYTKTKDVSGSATVINKADCNIQFRNEALSSGYYYDINYATADMNTNSGTRTFFMRSNHSKIGTTGKLRRLRFMYTYSANTTSFKLQIWRKVSGTYTLIHNTDILSLLGTATGIIEPVLSTPLDVVEGDFIALCIANTSADNILTNSHIGAGVKTLVYSNAEQTTGYDWEVTATDYSALLIIQTFVDAPVLACTGDSRMAGRPNYATIIEDYIDKLDRTNQIPYQLETLDSKLTYINFGYGGDTLSDIYDNIQWVINTRPTFVLLNGGINDVAGGVTNNTTIVTDYENIVDACNDAGIPVLALSVMPWTSGTNTQSAQIDALNILLNTMMSAKDGIFIDLTTTMGQFRTGGDVGNLWDMATAYNADGVHLNVAGATACAGKIYTDFANAYTIPDRSNTDNLDRSDTTIASATSRSADKYDSGNPYQFNIDELSDFAVLNTYFETTYQDRVFAKITTDDIEEVINYLTKKTGADLAQVKSYCNIT